LAAAHASHWIDANMHLRCLIILFPASIIVTSTTPRPFMNKESSALAYAGTSSAAGPMSQVDPNARSGGCPFLVKSHDAHVTYAVPALFDNNDSNSQQKQEQRPIVLFDGACTLCNNFVQFLLKYDRYGNLRFAALQSKVGELLLRRMSQEVRDEVLHQTGEGAGSEGSNEGEEGGGEKYKSIVLCTPDETYIQSSAVLKILAALSSSSSSTSTSKPSKRIKLLQYLGLLGYIVPSKLRDSMYKYISKRRNSWFGSADECMLYDERFDDRFVDDGVLTGIYRDPFANPIAPPPPSSKEEEQEVVTNLFESDSPPKRGDTVQIIWPSNTNLDPSITYDDEFPNGLCLIGGRGTISTIDLPLRILLRVERKSLKLSLSVLS
jgi:predicted DCC family thiol-disulfide oxidoreductase YuxK